MTATTTATATATHLLIAETVDGPRLVTAYRTYDEAVAAHTTLTDDHLDDASGVRWFAVRSSDDPRYRNAMPFRIQDPRAALSLHANRAAREWLRKEVGQTARAMLTKAEDGASLSRIEGDVKRSLAARGLHVEGYMVDNAIKSRVTLGRCWTCEDKRRSQAPGYWFPKTEGPLHGKRCPRDGDRLAQTTLALGAGFRRLPKV